MKSGYLLFLSPYHYYLGCLDIGLNNSDLWLHFKFWHSIYKTDVTNKVLSYYGIVPNIKPGTHGKKAHSRIPCCYQVKEMEHYWMLWATIHSRDQVYVWVLNGKLGSAVELSPGDLCLAFTPCLLCSLHGFISSENLLCCDSAVNLEENFSVSLIQWYHWA